MIDETNPTPTTPKPIETPVEPKRPRLVPNPKPITPPLPQIDGDSNSEFDPSRRHETPAHLLSKKGEVATPTVIIKRGSDLNLRGEYQFQPNRFTYKIE